MTCGDIGIGSLDNVYVVGAVVILDCASACGYIHLSVGYLSTLGDKIGALSCLYGKLKNELVAREDVLRHIERHGESRL